MATRYRLLPQAEADYFAIYVYTYENFSEARAEKYIGGLLDTFTLFTEYNSIGRGISHVRAGYFRYEYESHTIYYRHDQDGISNVRIVGERQDPIRYL